MAGTVSFMIKVSDGGTFKKVEVDADSLRDAVEHVKEETERLNHAVVNWAQASQAVDLLQRSMGGLVEAAGSATAAYGLQEVAEQKLAVNMRNTMGARAEDIESIKALCSAQQALGVIGGEVQLSGAQELATYLEKKSSLERLIPVMNDMLAQQYGLSASQESAAQIASMLGKVMDGQVGALSRYGYGFDAAQEEILKFGTEEERAAVLAEVVESSVGGMNAALAKTESGKAQQLANALGDIKARLGGLVAGLQPLVTLGAGLADAASGAAKCVTTLKALGAALGGASVKSAALAAHARVQSVAQHLLAGSAGSATAGTWALNAAVAALYATLTLGVSLVIGGLVALFHEAGSAAAEAADGTDGLKESVEALKGAASGAKAELDMEVLSLGRLIGASGDATKKVEELNRKWGDALGYHRTAAEWYDTLVTKSKAYCMQLGYEAQAKVLASQIAAKELERDAKAEEHRRGGGQWLDGRGKTHYNWEQWHDGARTYEALGSEVRRLDEDLGSLRAQYDTCTRRMLAARDELASQAAAATLAGRSIAIEEMTYEELGRALEENQSRLKGLAPTETAEINRITALNARLEDRKKQLGALLGLERASAGAGPGGGAGAATEPARAEAKTLSELGEAIGAYERRLKSTDPAEAETIRLLTAEIAKYKEKQLAVEQTLHAAGRPAELKTLEEIDAELQWQQGLRRRVGAEQARAVDAEIARLNGLKTAFEEQSHAARRVDEIETYEQLEEALSYYEGRLRRASGTEREEIQRQITALGRLRSEWDETLAASSAPEDIGRLDSLGKLEEAIAYYGARQKRASAEEIASIQRTVDALEEKRAALERLKRLPAMERELGDLGGLEGKELRLELELVGAEGIKGKIRELQKMLSDTRNPLGAEQRQEVRQMISAWEDYGKQLRRSQASLRDAWGGVKGIGSGVESITAALEGNGNAWARVEGVVDGVLGLYDGLRGVIETVEMLTAVSTAHGAAKAAEATAETAEAGTLAAASATEATASVATAGVLGVETAAWSALAAAKTFAAHASIPFVGAAIAAGYIAAQQATILAAAIPKFADGGLAYGPTVGIFGEYANARTNPEVVAPLDRLKALIGAGAGETAGKVEFRIKGRRLAGVLERENRHRQRS